MKTNSIIAMMAVIVLAAGYAWAGENNAWGNRSDSICSAGWVNYANHYAREAANKGNQPKSWWQSLVENMKPKGPNKTETVIAPKATPPKVSKTSASLPTSAEKSNNGGDDTKTPALKTPKLYEVATGTGTDKEYAGKDRILISEVIKNVRYVYAGFDDKGYKTIAAAISAAKSGDIVYVHTGTYHESLTLKEGVSLIGEDGISTVIHGDYKPKVHVIYALGNNRIENLTISGSATHGSGGQSSAIKVEGSNVIIKNNRITSNRGYALYVRSGSDILIENNFFKDNHLGVQLPTTGTTIQYNTFVNNDIAINILGGKAPVVRKNIITNSSFQSIYEYADQRHPSNGYAVVMNNVLYNNNAVGGATAINLPPAIENWTKGNVLTNPMFADPASGNYAVMQNSRASGNGFDPNYDIVKAERDN